MSLKNVTILRIYWNMYKIFRSNIQPKTLKPYFFPNMEVLYSERWPRDEKEAEEGPPLLPAKHFQITDIFHYICDIEDCVYVFICVWESEGGIKKEYTALYIFYVNAFQLKLKAREKKYLFEPGLCISNIQCQKGQWVLLEAIVVSHVGKRQL